MKDFIIKGNKSTPDIFFSFKKAKFIIKGRLIPEDAEGLFEPVIDWVNKYYQKSKQNTQVIFDLEYFNSSSSREIIRLLDKMNILSKNNNTKVYVDWLYDEEDILDYGKDFSYISKIEFVYIERKFD